MFHYLGKNDTVNICFFFHRGKMDIFYYLAPLGSENRPSVLIYAHVFSL